MGFLTVYNGIIETIQGITPTTHSGTFFRPRAINSFLSIEDAARAGHSRTFELDLVKTGESPYISGGPVDFQSAQILLTISYSLGSVRRPEELQDMMSEDMRDIVGTLRIPETWNSFAFELYTDPEGPQGPEDVLNDNDEKAGYVMSYLITAEWSN